MDGLPESGRIGGFEAAEYNYLFQRAPTRVRNSSIFYFREYVQRAVRSFTTF